MICKTCGMLIAEGSAFCEHCGNPNETKSDKPFTEGKLSLRKDNASHNNAGGARSGAIAKNAEKNEITEDNEVIDELEELAETEESGDKGESEESEDNEEPDENDENEEPIRTPKTEKSEGWGVKAFVYVIMAFLMVILLSLIVGLLTVGITLLLSPGILITSILSNLIKMGMLLKWISSATISVGLFMLLKRNRSDMQQRALYAVICSVIFLICAGVFIFNPGSSFEKNNVRPTLAGMYRFVNYTPLAKWITVWPVFKVFYNVSDNATFNGNYFFEYIFNTKPPDGMDVKEVQPVLAQADVNQIDLAKAADELKQRELARLQEIERSKREREIKKTSQLAEENKRIAEENERIAAEIHQKEAETQKLKEMTLIQKMQEEESKINAFFEKGLEKAKINFNENIRSMKGYYFFLTDGASSGKFSIIQAKDLIIKTKGIVPEDATFPETNKYNVVKKGYFYWEGDAIFTFGEFRTKEIPGKFIDAKKVKKNHAFFVNSTDKLYKYINVYPWSDWQTSLNGYKLELKYSFSESNGKWDSSDLSKYSFVRAGIDAGKLNIE